MTDKLRPAHLDRKAIIYLRQSSPQQVLNCRESTQRQYALAERAGEFGWPPQRIQIIDEDLGRSGASAVWRSGFQILAKEVADGQVGAVFALEISRFARSSADWHQLLDLCGWSSTMIVDEQTVYDPRDPNDRLLLGLKGQMSEAERYWMHLRLDGGRMNKARRGEYVFTTPIGYVWNPDLRAFEQDPNERIRAAISLIFERFRIDGTAHGVLRYLVRHGVQLPRHPPGQVEVTWDQPGLGMIYRLLHSPLYAGAYVFGRRETRPVIREGRLVGVRQVAVEEASWKVFLKGRHEGYITWDEFMANQKRLDANCADYKRPRRRGAPRVGEALLQGLLLCGKCGLRMHVSYCGRDQTSRYQCQSCAIHGEDRTNCWSTAASDVDSAVVARFLTVADPPEVDLCLAVSREAERQSAELDRQWHHRLEQASYDARLAERRYLAVDPDNRTVARTLETRWEERLREKEEVERTYQQARRDRRIDLGPQDRARILQLAQNLRRVWQAETTTADQRKKLLRVLIQEIALSPLDGVGYGARIEILWETGAVERLEVRRPPRRFEVSEEARAAILADQMKGLTDREIAHALNTAGIDNGRQRPWDARLVERARERARIELPVDAVPPVRGARTNPEGLLSTRAMMDRFGVSLEVAYAWAERGLIERVRDPRRRRYWFRLDEEALARIAGDGGPHRGRPPAPHQRADGALSAQGVAARFGVSLDRVHRWTREHILTPLPRSKRREMLWFQLDEATINRIHKLVSARQAQPPQNPPAE